MKSTFRTMTIAACFALVSLTSCYFPGSDQYKIKSATKEYVKSQLGEVRNSVTDTWSVNAVVT